MIYFIQSEVGGPIKIGCTQNPIYRLSQLQTGSPVKLVILGSMNGDEAKEKEIHKMFLDDLLYGEWFAASDKLVSFIFTTFHCSAKRQEICPVSLYVNEFEVAKTTGFSVHTLRNWRFRREGPSYYKTGKAVRYKMADIVLFMEKGRQENPVVEL